MKKRLLSIFCFILFAASAFAQNVTADPTEAYGEGFVEEVADIGTHFDVINNEDIDVELLWSIETLDAPDAWKVYFCDKNLCYAPGETACDPEKPNVLNPDSLFIGQFHVLIAGVTGIGTYNVHFTSSSNPGEVILTVPVTISALSTDVEDLQVAENIKLYPNPTSDVFQITNANTVSELVVYNIVGKEIKTFEANNGDGYDVSDIPNGMYLVRLFDYDSKVVKVIRLSKR